MRFLRKIVLAICLILLLALLKILFKKLFPHSLIFHYNLLSCLQLLLLLWAIITGLMEATVWKHRPPARSRRYSFLFFLALITGAESGSLLLLHHPRHIPPAFLSSFQYYYNNYQRDILQYNKNISRYDPAVFYRMKANNRSLFSNIEFSDSIVTDGIGDRNTPNRNNPNPHNPTILCLGDSYTLGWGVQQQEAYPALLEKMLKTPVLNTGMSSYGTAREIGSIRPLDKSELTTVIIQYCYNDADENKAYADNHFRLAISPASSYDSAVNSLRWSKLYFPGKCFCTLAKLFLTEKLQPHPNPSPLPSTAETQEANRFLDVLRNSDLDFTRIQLFVFDIRDYRGQSDAFVLALRQQLTDPRNNAAFNGHIHVLSITGLLTPNDYYILDEHTRASGQKKLAAYLAEAIRRNTGISSGAIKAAASAAPALVK